MGDTTRNLSLHEFACPDGCGLARPHPYVVCGIQWVLDATGATAVIVTSGCRCGEHNHVVGGAPNSQHLPRPEQAGYTCAADIELRGVPISRALAAVELFSPFAEGGIGLYLDGRPGKRDRLHVDCRRGVARWGWVDGRQVTWQNALSEMNRRNTP